MACSAPMPAPDPAISSRCARSRSKPATRVVFAPAQQICDSEGSSNALKRTFFGRPLTQGDVVATAGQQRVDNMPPGVQQFLRAPAYALQEIRLAVIGTAPKGVVHVDENTEIELRPEYEEPKEARRADVTYDDIGGMGPTIDQLREMVELPLRYPELFQRLGVDPPKGVLLHGPPGTGKTRLARAVANESAAEFYLINGPEIMGSAYGESEGKLRQVFEEAAKNAPSIVFIDEIDLDRTETRPGVGRGGEAPRRAVADLDGRAGSARQCRGDRRDQSPEAIDEALRRPGRFDREIVVGVPDERGRREILGIHTRGMPLGDKVDLNELARTTYGFVGADLAALAREAAIEAVRKIMPRLNLAEGTIPPEVLDTLAVTREDFLDALKRVQPSAMREVMVEAPRVRWDDVGGLDKAQARLKEGVELPLKDPDAFRRLGIRPAKGFLLYGPPGTGKTLLAKAVAREAEANFIATKSSDLLSKWYGESEQQIARLFARARQVAPCVIFIDELDLAGPRARWWPWRAAGDRARGQHHPGRDGRARGASVSRGDRRDQPAQPDRPGTVAAGPVRRAGLCRCAGQGRATAHPGNPDRQDATRRRCRSRRDGEPHRALHWRRPGGSGPPGGPGRAAPVAIGRRSDDGAFRGSARRFPCLGDA